MAATVSSQLIDLEMAKALFLIMPSYETTVEQRQRLLTDGFVLLPGALPSELLAYWRDPSVAKRVVATVARRWGKQGRNVALLDVADSHESGTLPTSQQVQPAAVGDISPIPAVYCRYDIETKDCPVPSDFRPATE